MKQNLCPICGELMEIWTNHGILGKVESVEQKCNHCRLYNIRQNGGNKKITINKLKQYRIFSQSLPRLKVLLDNEIELFHSFNSEVNSEVNLEETPDFVPVESPNYFEEKQLGIYRIL